MKLNLIGAFVRNKPFGTEIAFEKGLRELGHEVSTFDPDHGGIFSSDADATVIFKWLENDLRVEIKEMKGKKIVYQPDDIRFPHIRQMMLSMRDVCDFALTYDDEAAQIAKDELGYLKSEKLLLTADPTIYYPEPSIQKDIDVCFIGSLTGGPNHSSRARMIRALQSQNRFPLKMAVASDVKDVDLIRRIYNRSKIILNHATDVGQPFGKGYGLQCRHFEAGMTKACLLSNELIGPCDLQNFETFGSEEELFSKIRSLLDDEIRRKDLASRLYDEILFGHMPVNRATSLTKFIESI